MRSRAKVGMTIPAAPRMVSASEKPELGNWGAGATIGAT